MPDFAKPYDAKETERDIYQQWLDSGFFSPDHLPGERSQPFTVMMPPPNRTGTLHVGHALGTTIQDILIRFERMRGKKALWLPGTDHAAIATQAKVESLLYKEEGKTRHDLGREAFLERVNAFAEQSHDTIVEQTRRMGASCDWSREAYTLDADRNLAVNTAFQRMYDDGLIYRGQRIVNWDPKGQTTISDDEIVYEERPATLWTFRYSADFPIPIATTRPETKVGDVAVAVHPDDARYASYVGKTYSVAFCGVPLSITVVADAAVDPTFGTGAVGITPAHSFIDWDIAERHSLSPVQVINEYARMMVGDERLRDKKVAEARTAVVAWLREEGLLEKEEAITQSVATAERTGGVVEPLPKLQWFVGVNRPFTMGPSTVAGIKEGDTVTLKQLMRAVVAEHQIALLPDHVEKTYFYWIDNLRDWCISRQIWFGHRVPVWYRTHDGKEELVVSATVPVGEGWTQDPDTLDTWFSSGLWTFSTLGWPKKDAFDLATYHPTDVLETGRDILFFWIARMILMTTYLLGDIPFRTVYLHGMVRDEKRQKMSKSKGNIIDPLVLIDQYGTDALRMGLIVGNTPGTDLALSEEKVKGYKHFANKIWNAARFVTMNLDAGQEVDAIAPPALRAEDQAILDELAGVRSEVTRLMSEYKFYLAAEQLYHYFWHTFADTIIEAQKPRLKDDATRAAAQYVLVTGLTTCLKLLHPFMPFVTEAVWQALPKKEQRLLLVEPWPA